MTFYDFVKEKRKEHHITLQTLADKMSYTKPYMFNIENGYNKPFKSYEKLKRLADALDLNETDEKTLYTLACGEHEVPADVIEILLSNPELYDLIRRHKIIKGVKNERQKI